ncbi:hypothetical protein KM043_003160 [Ampulex compressa]|nr:hypothetical protein KM043_003160 [Ampulex compressa]
MSRTRCHLLLLSLSIFEALSASVDASHRKSLQRPLLPSYRHQERWSSRGEIDARPRRARFVPLRVEDGRREEHKQRVQQEACVAPDNMDGHCDHPGICPFEKLRRNFTLLEKHTCTIDEEYIGVCCPDVLYGMESNTLDRETLAGVLPAIANTNYGDAVSTTELGESKANTSKSTDLKDNARVPRRPRGCGTTGGSKTRIIGGRPADPREWPWMAALLKQDVIQYCGGVLITDRHILTAAHCVYKYRPRDIKVRLGEYDLTSNEETRSLDFAVTETRIHRDFDYGTYENDIAIVKIHRPTTFNAYIWPVCLPPIRQSFENKNAVVTGWGTQYYGGPASTVLMEVAVPIWPQDKCARSFTQRIPNTAMCAGAYEGGRDACQGDSGGPLLHQLANGRWVNVGIVSWGIRCGEPGRPGIYTRVNAYLDWIFANAVF